ncbi:MAG: phosphate ABC transporter permease PstA, partial [Candidatus Enteromonas sp.]
TAFGIAIFAALLAFVLVRGAGALSFDFLFGEYGEKPSILPAILGTLQLVLVSVLIALPIGIGTAVFLSEYTQNSSKPAKFIRLCVETLASIPSIVYGIFGYLVFVVGFSIGDLKFFGWGYSLLGGGLTLVIMILPLIVKSTEEALREVPNSLREASFALGAGKAKTVFSVVLPSAAPGILTSVILSIGRIVSESAVLLLTVGMVVNLVPTGPMSSGTSLALDVYYFSTYGYAKEAGAASFVLMVLVLALNVLAYVLMWLLKGKRHGNE